MSPVVVTAIAFGALLVMDIGCWIGFAHTSRPSRKRNQMALVSSLILVAVAVWGVAFAQALAGR